jgi:acyl-CoA synthetase (NDP forming)
LTKFYYSLDRIFHPQSVAFVGISISNPLHWTRTFWYSCREFGFQGPLYPVNPSGGELDGCQVYKSLDEIPGNVDYVISTVSAGIAPEIVRNCARKGVKAIHFCTAGFDETGEAVTAGLQGELTRLARETGVRIIGPNCMGIYCPASRLSYGTGFAKEAGNVGLISQSGANSIYVIHEANWRGVRFSKVISYGNACDLNECDFLEYLTDDPETGIIALYLEGVSNGRRFLRLIERAARSKPVILLKAGYGEAGARATATHTASLAGNDTIWETLCRQFNLIRTKNVEEMVDVLVTLSFMPDPGGRNALLIGMGGGTSVLLTDEFERRGFRLPVLPESIRQKLMGFSQLAGNMLRNPIDYSQNMIASDDLIRAVDVLTDWDEADFCVGFIRPSQMPPYAWSFMQKWGQSMFKAYLGSRKPLAFICDNAVLPERHNATYSIWQEFVKARLPLYYSYPGAAEALRLVVQYNERKQGA